MVVYSVHNLPYPSGMTESLGEEGGEGVWTEDVL